MSEPNVQIKKRQMIFIGGAVTGIPGLAGTNIFLFDNSPAQRRERPKTVSITASGTMDDKGAWRAQQAAKEKSNGALIGEVKAQLKAQEEQNEKLMRTLKELEANKATADSAGSTAAAKPDVSVLDKPLPIGSGTGPDQRVLQSPNDKDGATALNQPLNQVDVPVQREVEIIIFNNAEGEGTTGAAVGGAGDVTEVLGFPTDGKAKRYGTASGGADGKKQTIEFLPVGSFVRMAMLNDVDAPTGGQAQSNPLLVAFRVLDIANLASKHKLDIKSCRIVAATWGDLSSERMMGRTETLACVINDEAIEMAIKDQVIGEDGKVEVRDHLITKQGQLLANALFAGALSGIGKAFQPPATITSIGGDGVAQTIGPGRVGQAAIDGGINSAGQQLAQYYFKAAGELYPVTETDGGRTVGILTAKGAVYSGKALAKDGYRDLLKRTGINSRRYEDD